MELYHIADIHLGAVVSRLGNSKHSSLIMQRLEGLFNKASQERVRFIVMAGDIFDSNTLPSSIIRRFIEFLKRYEELQFILIPGGGSKIDGDIRGHDAYSDESLYKRPDISGLIASSSNVHLLTPEDPVKLFRNESIAFYGGFFDLPAGEPAEGVMYHVAVMHGPFGDRPEFGEISIPEMVERKFNYMALGHYHGFKRISHRAYYSGAFIQFEYLPLKDAVSGYLKVRLGNGDPDVQHIAFKDAPRFIRMSVMNGEDQKTLKELCAGNAFIKITEYLEDFKPFIDDLTRQYPGQIDVGEGACIKRSSLIYMEILEELIEENVPGELREDVREFLLYGLQVSSRKKDVEKFIKDMFHLER